MRENLKPLALLAFLQVCSFGVFAPRLGFYHDDWSILEIGLHGADLAGKIRAYAVEGGLWARPLEIPQYALLVALGGRRPAVYQAILGTLGTLEAFLLFLLLERLTGGRRLALTAAALAAILPNRFVTHVWFANSPQAVTQTLAAASLACHASWAESRRPSRLAASQFLYLLGMLSYESCAFIPLLLAGGLAARFRLSGDSTGRAARRALADASPYALTLLAASAWQWAGIRLLLHMPNPKSQIMALSLRHALRAYGAGLECVANRVLHICALGLRQALRDFGAPGFLACAALAAVATTLLESLPLPARPSSPRGKTAATEYSEGGLGGPPGDIPIALSAAAAGFVGAYAPYAASGTYMPQVFGIMGRTNGTGAWVAGLLWASGLSALSRARLGGGGSLGRILARALLALAVAAFTWTNWANALQWARSWTLQQDILRKAAPRVAAIPGPASVILVGAPSFAGWAVVFDAHYDFGAALRLTTGRSDLRTNIWSPRLRYAPDRLVACDDGRVTAQYPYDNLYLYHYDEDRLERVGKPPDAAILLQSSPRKGSNPCERP